MGDKMDCEYKHCNAILAIVILVFSFWQVTLNWFTSKWIIVAVAVLILFNSIGSGKSNNRICSVKKVSTKKKAKKAVKRKKK